MSNNQYEHNDNSEKVKVTLTLRLDVANEIESAIENWLGRDADNDNNFEYQQFLDRKVRNAMLTIARAIIRKRFKL